MVNQWSSNGQTHLIQQGGFNSLSNVHSFIIGYRSSSSTRRPHNLVISDCLIHSLQSVGELLSEFANYFHYGYHECMKNLVHYLTTVERTETKDTKYARILAFLQSKVVSEPVFGSRFEPAFSSPEPVDFLCQLRSPPECHQSPSEPVFQPNHGGHLAWHGSTLTYPQQHGLDPHHYVNFMGHTHGLHTAPHVAL